MSGDCRNLRLTTVHENGLVGAKSCVFNKLSGNFQGRSDRFLGDPELAFGDDGPVHRHNSLDKSCFSGHFHDRHLQDHGMTRVDRNEESHLVDAGQDQVLTLCYAFARNLAKKDGSALSDRLHNEGTRHDRIVGEMAEKLDLVPRDIFDGLDSFAGLDLQHPVDHDEREPLPKVVFDLLEGHCHRINSI